MVDPVLREEYGLTAYALEPIALGVINRNLRAKTPARSLNGFARFWGSKNPERQHMAFRVLC